MLFAAADLLVFNLSLQRFTVGFLHYQLSVVVAVSRPALTDVSCSQFVSHTIQATIQQVAADAGAAAPCRPILPSPASDVL